MDSDADEFRVAGDNIIKQIATNGQQVRHLQAQMEGLTHGLGRVSDEELVTVANGLKYLIQSMQPPVSGEALYLSKNILVINQYVGAEILDRDGFDMAKLDGIERGEWDIEDL